MKRDEMNNIVKSELKNIPRNRKGSDQNFLRLFYNGLRRPDLAQKSPQGPSAVLKMAIKQLQKTNPDFEPNFDKSFFK